MKNDTKTIDLPSGSKIEYKNYLNAGLYLDLQNIPEELAGDRIRMVAKSLVVSFAGDTIKSSIGQKIEEMSIKDLGILASELLKVIQGSDDEDKKKTNRPLSELDTGEKEVDDGDANGGSDA